MTLGKLALRNMARRPARTALLVASIAIAIATALALLALSRSIETSVHESVDERGADLTVSQRNASDLFGGAIPMRLESRIATVRGVRAINGELAMFAPAEGNRNVLTLGWTPAGHFWKALPMRDGRAPQPGETGVAVIGEGLAATLGKKVGDEVEIFDRKLRIVGVAGYRSAVNRNMLILPLADLQDIAFRADQVTVFHIALERPTTQAEIDRVTREIEALGNVTVTPTDQLLRQDRNLAVLRAVSQTISMVALATAGLSVLNALLMAVQERTRETGILMAIGWSKRRIIGSIMVEGVVAGFFGCLVGVPIGYLACSFFNRLPAIGDFLTFLPTFDMVAASLLAGIALSALGSLYPAWRATSLTPAQALRRA